MTYSTRIAKIIQALQIVIDDCENIKNMEE
jgi:hypothetical protein